MEGILMHQLKRYEIDGEKVRLVLKNRQHTFFTVLLIELMSLKVIVGKMDPDLRVEEFSFEAGEVYAIDIVISTGEGKSKEADAKPTIYKRVADTTYPLKLKTSRTVLSEINRRHMHYPFHIR
jgi:hypothetical protein